MQSLSLPGYRGQKAEVLIALKKSQPLTAKELGARFDLTANALRRHLDSLEEDGVITHRVEARGVGAPVHTYSLTSKGEELFPHAYTEALSEVLDAVRRAGGGDEIIAVFRRKWEKIAADALPLLDALSFNERAQLLAELLNAEGFMAEAETPTPTSAVVRKHHCAIKAVAEHFPEICGVEQEFFQIVLGAQVTREQHILEGCNHCAFTAQLDTPGPAVSA